MNTSKAPEILVFEIGTVAVFVYFDGYLVLAFLEIARHVELGGLHGALRIPYPLAVDPDIERRHDALEAQESLTASPTIGHIERAAILAGGVALLIGRPFFLGLTGHVRRIYLKRIASRNVYGCTITVDLPVGWNT